MGTRAGVWYTLLVSYINANTGSSNAYTDTEDTVYYFDVDAAFLEVRQARERGGERERESRLFTPLF